MKIVCVGSLLFAGVVVQTLGMQFGLKPSKLEIHTKMRSAASAPITCLGGLGHEESVDENTKTEILH